VVVGLCVFIRRSRWLATLAILVAFSNGIYCTQVLLPAYSHEHSLKNYSVLVNEISGPHAKLVVYGSLRDSLTYYHGLDNFQHFEEDDLDLMLTFLKYNSDVYIIAEGLVFGEMWGEIRGPGRPEWHLVSDEHPLYTLISDQRPASITH
jgi:hypothetical protein